MLNIKYCKQGQAIPDFSCSVFADHYVELALSPDPARYVDVSTENIIHEMRARIRGGLSCRLVGFELDDGNVYYTDENGAMVGWPDGLADHHYNTLLKIIGIK